ncbi:MAG: nucleotidyltransferase family protein [Deltaproteobacteria bacterium]
MGNRKRLLEDFIISCFAEQERIGSLASDDQDSWARLSYELENSCLMGFAYQAVQTGRTDWIPPANILMTWKQLAHRIALQNAFYEVHTAAVCGLLNQSGIPYVILKGLSLADACYANRSIRQIGDIDILINPEDLPQVMPILQEQGYEFCPLPALEVLGPKALQVSLDTFHEITMTRDISFFKINVDLHWQVNRFLPGSPIHKIFPESDIPWLDHTRRLDVQGTQVSCLSFEGEFMFCVFHYVLHHMMDGPKWFVDLCQFLRVKGNSLEWHRIAELASDRNLQRLLTLVVALYAEVSGDTEVSRKAAAAGFCRDEPSASALRRYQANIFKPSSRLRRYRNFVTLPAGFSDRWTVLRYILFNKSASVEGRNPDIHRNSCVNLVFVMKRALGEIMK